MERWKETVDPNPRFYAEQWMLEFVGLIRLEVEGMARLISFVECLTACIVGVFVGVTMGL